MRPGRRPFFRFGARRFAVAPRWTGSEVVAPRRGAVCGPRGGGRPGPAVPASARTNRRGGRSPRDRSRRSSREKPAALIAKSAERQGPSVKRRRPAAVPSADCRAGSRSVVPCVDCRAGSSCVDCRARPPTADRRPPCRVQRAESRAERRAPCRTSCRTSCRTPNAERRTPNAERRVRSAECGVRSAERRAERRAPGAVPSAERGAPGAVRASCRAPCRASSAGSRAERRAVCRVPSAGSRAERRVERRDLGGALFRCLGRARGKVRGLCNSTLGGTFAVAAKAPLRVGGRRALRGRLRRNACVGAARQKRAGSGPCWVALLTDCLVPSAAAPASFGAAGLLGRCAGCASFEVSSCLSG